MFWVWLCVCSRLPWLLRWSLQVHETCGHDLSNLVASQGGKLGEALEILLSLEKQTRTVRIAKKCDWIVWHKTAKLGVSSLQGSFESLLPKPLYFGGLSITRIVRVLINCSRFLFLFRLLTCTPQAVFWFALCSYVSNAKTGMLWTRILWSLPSVEVNWNRLVIGGFATEEPTVNTRAGCQLWRKRIPKTPKTKTPPQKSSQWYSLYSSSL